MISPSHPRLSDRRGFIRHFALSTAVSMVGGKLWTARLLADVSPFGEPIGRIVIKLGDYPALASQFGAVRFRFAGLDGGAFPFSLNRADETTFYAVDTRCTHAGCMVNAFESTRFAMVCDCHQSEYNIMGEVVAGPATNDLMRYNVTFDGNDTVTVFIPGLDMTLRDIAVQEKTATTIRVRLDFPTIQFGKYKVQYRQNLSDDPIDVFFSTTPDGPATLSDIEVPGLSQTLYVDAALPSGFFSVALVVEPI